MRKALATGLAIGIIAVGAAVAPSTASALTVGQSTKTCNGWAQHSNSAVYWRTCAVILQKTKSTKYAHTSLEVKNVGARSKIITGLAFGAIDVPAGYGGGQTTKTLPAGQTWTMHGMAGPLSGHSTYYALSGMTIRGYAAKESLRRVSVRF